MAFFVRGKDLRAGAAWFSLVYSSGACISGVWGITHPDNALGINQSAAILTVLFSLIAVWASREWSKKIVAPESIITLTAALTTGIAVVYITY